MKFFEQNGTTLPKDFLPTLQIGRKSDRACLSTGNGGFRTFFHKPQRAFDAAFRRIADVTGDAGDDRVVKCFNNNFAVGASEDEFGADFTDLLRVGGTYQKKEEQQWGHQIHGVLLSTYEISEWGFQYAITN